MQPAWSKARFPLPELTAQVNVRPELMGDRRPVNSASGNARPSTWPVLTGNGNRSPVNSGSGNRDLTCDETMELIIVQNDYDNKLEAGHSIDCTTHAGHSIAFFALCDPVT